jgi:hypothetical protein
VGSAEQGDSSDFEGPYRYDRHKFLSVVLFFLLGGLCGVIDVVVAVAVSSSSVPLLCVLTIQPYRPIHDKT